MRLPKIKLPFVSKKTKEEKKKEAYSGVTARITVYRTIGRDVPAFVASFIATQTKDKGLNLILENQDEDFKEEVSKVWQRALEQMKHRLEDSTDSKEQKKKKIEDAIRKQDNRVKSIRDGYVFPQNILEKYDKNQNLTDEEWTNAEKVNVNDEEAKLKNLKVLKDYVQWGGDGSYEKFNENGEREYEFKYQDGVLYPVLHVSNTNTNYTDMVSKRKIHADTAEDINREFMDETSSPFQNLFGKIMWVLVIAMIIGNGIWSVENHNNSMEFNEMLDNSKLSQVVQDSIGSYAFCTRAYKVLVRDNAELIEYAKNDIINKSGRNKDSAINDKDRIDEIIDLSKEMNGDSDK